MKSMLGRLVGDSTSSPWGVSDAEVSDSEQLVTKRRTTAKPPTRIPKRALLLALKGLSPLFTILEPSVFLGGYFDAKVLNMVSESNITLTSCGAGGSGMALSTKLHRRVLLGVRSRMPGGKDTTGHPQPRGTLPQSSSSGCRASPAGPLAGQLSATGDSRYVRAALGSARRHGSLRLPGPRKSERSRC